MGLAPSARALKIMGMTLRGHSFDELGALPLAEGGGAKHSPLTGAQGKCGKNHQKSTFLKIIRDHPRALRNTPGHV